MPCHIVKQADQADESDRTEGISSTKGNTMELNYTDIHCHILPGVDDGAENMELAMTMLSAAYEEGCRRIILTPHYERGRNSYEPKELDGIFEEVKERAAKLCPDMELYLGNELLYEEGVIQDVRDGLVHTLAGTRYLLVEFPIQISYGGIYQAMKELSQARFCPVVAHVERYHCLTGHMDRLLELEELGVTFQMNAESIFGSVFDENVRWCRKMLKKEIISFLGTDAHNMENRAPHMKEALEWMYRKLDADYIQAISVDYPGVLLANEYLD